MLSQQINSAMTNNVDTFTQEAFFHRKKIDRTVFHHIKLSAQVSIAHHSKFAFQHFYSTPYLNATKTTGTIARYHHGIAHANRVASYIPVFANLYKKYYSEANVRLRAGILQLTNDDLKLVQIAGLFHDACRENDGTDYWDKDSAILLYLYLNAIGINKRVRPKFHV
jgi:hypothetical protein